MSKMQAAEETAEGTQAKHEHKETRVVEAIPLKDGLLMPRDSIEEARVAGMMLSTGILPTCFVTREQVILAVQMLRALRIEPALGIRQVMVVNNVLAIWGELPKAVCQRHIETIEEIRFTEKYEPISFKNKNLHVKPFGAVVTVKRRDVALPVESYFTLQQAIEAGLIVGGKKSAWNFYPERMLQMRARSRALKDLFPDVLSGVAIAEYDFNILDGRGTPIYGEVSKTARSLADEINEAAEEPRNVDEEYAKNLGDAPLTE